LADVRNGYGFAGVITGYPVKPIADPRGLPDDFQMDGEEGHPIKALSIMDVRRQKYQEDGDPLTVWMGDHTHSWLTGEEMLQYRSAAPTITKCGIISRSQYDEWDKKSSPSSYSSGGISGRDVVVAESADDTRSWTHIRVFWLFDLGSELSYFFDEVERLTAEHGSIRFVFGFDS